MRQIAMSLETSDWTLVEWRGRKPAAPSQLHHVVQERQALVARRSTAKLVAKRSAKLKARQLQEDNVRADKEDVDGREVGQALGRRRTVNTETSKLAATRDKRTGGGQPPNTTGGNTAKGETAHRGTPPADRRRAARGAGAARGARAAARGARAAGPEGRGAAPAQQLAAEGGPGARAQPNITANAKAGRMKPQDNLHVHHRQGLRSERRASRRPTDYGARPEAGGTCLVAVLHAASVIGCWGRAAGAASLRTAPNAPPPHLMMLAAC